MSQEPEKRRPEKQSGDGNDSEEVGTAHTHESSGRHGSLKALHYWCWAQGSLVHPEEEAPLHCHLEEETSDSSVLFPQQPLTQVILHY